MSTTSQAAGTMIPSSDDPWQPHLYATRVREVRRASYVPAGRALHLVDIENLMGGPMRGLRCASDASDRYRELASPIVGDHWCVATNPSPDLASLAHSEFPNAKLCIRGGKDGADLALLDIVNDIQWIAQRYDRVVIGSGDGIFTSIARQLVALGVHVDVVAPVFGAAASLVAVADHTWTLDTRQLGRIA